MRSISSRLAFIYSFVALVITLMLFVVNFSDSGLKAVAAIETQVSQIVSATEGGAALSLFDLNQQAAQQVIDSLMKYPFVEQARIRLDNGSIFVEHISSPIASNDKNWATQLLVKQPQKLIERNLYAHGHPQAIGKLEILINYDQALAHFHQQTKRLFLNILVTTIIVFVLIYLITRWVIASPLVDLVHKLSDVSPTDLHKVHIKIPKSHEHSEIGVLVSAFNRFIELLEQSLQKRNSAEDALKKLNKELEARVKQRTHELEKLNKELKQLATIDNLTQVNNRRKFFELGKLKFNLFKRYNRPLVVAMLDIDHFKNINDQHGHQVGDVAIQSCAELCGHSLRETDVIGRIGGEEFGILFTETKIEGAIEIAERIRSIMPSDPNLQSKGIQMTVSIGLFELNEHTHSFAEALEYADKALYHAKKSGRNQVQVYLPK